MKRTKDSLCRPGADDIFGDDKDAISRVLDLAKPSTDPIAVAEEIADRIQFDDSKLMPSSTLRLDNAIADHELSFALLKRMRVKLIERYAAIDQHFGNDFDTMIEVVFVSGKLAGRLVALNPIADVKTQRDAPDAARARRNRALGQITRRRAGDPIRRAAIDYCRENPETTQGACAKKVADQCQTTIDNVLKKIRLAFEPVKGRGHKRLKRGWHLLLGGDDL